MDRMEHLHTGTNTERQQTRRRARWLAGTATVAAATLAVAAAAPPSTRSPHPIPTRLHFFEQPWENCDEPDEREQCDEHGFHPMEGGWAVGATLERADSGQPVAGVRVDFYRTTTLEGICFGRTRQDGKVHCDATLELAGIVADGGFLAVFSGDTSYEASEAHYVLQLEAARETAALP